jgi:hypothetical protein
MTRGDRSRILPGHSGWMAPRPAAAREFEQAFSRLGQRDRRQLAWPPGRGAGSGHVADGATSSSRTPVVAPLAARVRSTRT